MSSSAQWDSKQDKKLLKPLMEKRRRDRMNRSLERLRLLLLEATQDERLKNPKVEKAEILQKTVHFVRTQPPAGIPFGTAGYSSSLALALGGPLANPSWARTRYDNEPARQEETFLQRYHSGYRECLSQATRFLHSSPGICAGKKAYLMERICHCMEKITTRDLPTGSPFSSPAHGRYARNTLPSCSPPLGDAACILHPAPALPAGHRLQTLAAGQPQLENCNKGMRDKLNGSQNSAGQPQGLNVWRPWP
ncbi:transcription factor HES-7.1-like isoform X1 [Dermochelys coriacea]|uniref:transcription factor HES-7.1-like isoform X1 n=1 Tax=Dermochelys coriacea TaxID=27794 RepID=UPI0018E7A759|nr:transcription factor HES-7.1-like isoform X1 [Dermochelys coriacea]